MKSKLKRIISWVIVLAMVWTMVPAHTAALTAPEPVVHVEEPQSCLNPLYPGLSEELYIPALPEKSDASVLAVDASEYVDTYEDAAKLLREGMVNRQATIEVYYKTEDYDFSADSKEIFNQAIAHTGNPREGDALMWVWAGRSTGSSRYVLDGITYATLTYSITYYTTAEQEAELDSAIDSLLAELNPTGSSYEKLCTVYDCICENITYDYDNLEDDTYKLKYTAYAALINQTAVCQGYALLLYRLALELGIDCRFIGGTGNGGAHGWNIVKLGDCYYNVDATWDAAWMQQVGYYNYFLQCEKTFTEEGTDHIRDAEYDTEAFHTAYPMSETDFDPDTLTEVPNGTCGDSLTWELKNGVLTISGQGIMYDYQEDAPWQDYADDITQVVIAEGVTTIGDYAIWCCFNLTDVTLPTTVTSIGFMGFAGCLEMNNLPLPANLKSIGESAFAECQGMTELVIPAGVIQIADGAFEGCVGVKKITFLGAAPTIGEGAFQLVEAKAYYPAGDTSWTDDVMQDYGGTLSWEALCSSHSYESQVTAATCTDQGYTTHTCTKCGHSYVDAYVDPLGHTHREAEVENNVDATCDAAGSYDNVVYCTVCEEELSRETVNVPATGHSWGQWETTRAPACTEAGERTRSCGTCGAVETESIAANGHDYDAVTTAPTCEEQGYTTFTCVCGDSYVDNYVNAQGHTPGEAVAENPVEATCDAAGSYDEVVYCAVCETELSRETVAVSATGHSYGSWETTTEPTCTETGKRKRSCTDCGAEETESIPTTDHNYESVVTAPTCTKQGYTTHTCSTCGNSYVDTYVDALEHDMGEWVVTEDATCTEPGSKVRTCSRCDYEQIQAVRPSGHAYNGAETPPTCTEDGYITYVCEYCGDSYTEKGDANLGHDMGEWIADGEGMERRDCSRCDHYETREVEIVRPDAPSVKASNVASSGKIKLSWNAVDGAAKYQVYRSTDKETWTLLKTLTGTSLTNTSTTAGELYYYYVVAVAEDGTESEPSAIVSRRCDLARPVVTLSNVASSGKIKISWKAIEGAVKYQVYRSTDNENWTLLKTVTGTSLTNTSTEAGTLYYYKVKAIASNSEANSADSTVKSRRCDLARPVVTLSNVASTGKIKISWKAISGAVKYEVYRSTDNENWTLLKTMTGTSLTNTSTTAGTLYYYKVKAIASNSDANSAFSTVKSRTCDLARPTLTVTLNSKGQPYLSWTKVAGAVKYQVYRSTDGETWALLKTTTGTKLTNSSVTSGTTYYYKVYAVASVSSANSAYSTVKSIKAG